MQTAYYQEEPVQASETWFGALRTFQPWRPPYALAGSSAPARWRSCRLYTDRCGICPVTVAPLFAGPRIKDLREKVVDTSKGVLVEAELGG